MYNRFIFLLILIFGLVCVGGVSANDQLSLNTTDSGLNTDVSSQLSENSGDFVYSGDVSDSGVIVENNQPKSLNDLNDLINSGSGNIELNDDYRYNWLVDRGFDGISINGGNYVINGNNHTIDGGSRVSLFNVNGGSLTLLNINFVNFKGDGSVVYARNCELNITQCSLNDNTAIGKTYIPITGKYVYDVVSDSYGAVYLDGVNASICLSIFSNNSAKYGGAIYACNSNLTLVTNVFSSNVANGYGGAIYSSNSKIISSVNSFLNNTAVNGGAIYVGGGSYGSFIGNTFLNNTATRGGAVCLDDGSYDLLFAMDTFVNNSAKFYGGAIHSLTTDGAFVIYSNFMNNTASCGSSINVAEGTMISQGNAFDNETNFVPSWDSVCGNCVFMTMDVQNTTNADNTTVPRVHLVEAMRVNPEGIHFNNTNYQGFYRFFFEWLVTEGIRYNTNSYIIKNYYNDVSSSCIGVYLERLSALKNQSADVLAVSSLMSVFVEIEKELIALAKSNDTADFNVVMDVCNDDDLQNAVLVAQFGCYYDPFSDSFDKVSVLVLNFEKDHVFNFNTRSDGSVFTVNVGTLFLNGDNTTFKVVNPEDRNEFHFMYVGANSMVVTSSLIVSGFNTAIENYGVLCLFNTNFTGNRLDYIVDTDKGGAIINYGFVMGQNSSFINNHAKYGGALYNEGYINLVNCSFLNNDGYGEGDDVYNFNKGTSDLTNVSCSVVSGEGLNIFERIALHVGAGLLAVVAATAVGWIPGINVGVVAVVGSLVGGLIIGGSYALDGYLNHDVDSVEILIAAAVGAVIGGSSGYMGLFMVNCICGISTDGILAYHILTAGVIKGVVFATVAGIISGVFTFFTVPDEIDVPSQNITIPDVKI